MEEIASSTPIPIFPYPLNNRASMSLIDLIVAKITLHVAAFFAGSCVYRTMF